MNKVRQCYLHPLRVDSSPTPVGRVIVRLMVYMPLAVIVGWVIGYYLHGISAIDGNILANPVIYK